VSADLVVATESILASGHAIVDMSPDMGSVVRDIYRAGELFFRQPIDNKRHAATPGRLEGYRGLGAEYSESPDRVDLNESFSVWSRNAGHSEVRVWAAENALHQAMSKLLVPYRQLGAEILERLRQRIAPSMPPVLPSTYSYLQLNYYPLASANDRSILMDRHEDGHLLTLGTSNSPGLEVELNGHFCPVQLEANQVIVWVGSVLTALTGGLLSPMYHRVVRHDLDSGRQSINFFVNASLERGQQLWIDNETNHGIDIAELTIARSGSFGLPHLESVE
jgi:isopenicillin N synthase-like dioxygenase